MATTAAPITEHLVQNRDEESTYSDVTEVSEQVSEQVSGPETVVSEAPETEQADAEEISASEETPVSEEIAASEEAASEEIAASEEAASEEAAPASAPGQAPPLPDAFQAENTTCGSEVLTPEQTLILMDWDDTILPSSWVTRRGLTLSDSSVPTEEQLEELHEFALVALTTLRLARKMGTVVMVTNAETGWIELSCRKFMPVLMDEVEKFARISARSTYEPLGVSSPSEWKTLAFGSEISKFFEPASSTTSRSTDSSDGTDDGAPAVTRNVISVGDSSHERDAVMRATENSKNCRTKSLKMLERPEIEQLKEQHELIASFFTTIAEYDGHLDLCVRCS